MVWTTSDVLGMDWRAPTELIKILISRGFSMPSVAFILPDVNGCTKLLSAAVHFVWWPS